jgi:hypothetical protein
MKNIFFLIAYLCYLESTFAQIRITFEQGSAKMSFSELNATVQPVASFVQHWKLQSKRYQSGDTLKEDFLPLEVAAAYAQAFMQHPRYTVLDTERRNWILVTGNGYAGYIQIIRARNDWIFSYECFAPHILPIDVRIWKTEKRKYSLAMNP